VKQRQAVLVQDEYPLRPDEEEQEEQQQPSAHTIQCQRKAAGH